MLMFTISSFIKDNAVHDGKGVGIDILSIYFSSIQDEYGVTVGTKISKVAKLREGRLIFGANHMDNHLGGGKYGMRSPLQKLVKFMTRR
jgi:hypothetical protein